MSPKLPETTNLRALGGGASWVDVINRVKAEEDACGVILPLTIELAKRAHT